MKDKLAIGRTKLWAKPMAGVYEVAKAFPSIEAMHDQKRTPTGALIRQPEPLIWQAAVIQPETMKHELAPEKLYLATVALGENGQPSLSRSRKVWRLSRITTR